MPIAHASTYFNLGSDFASNTLSQAGTIFSDLNNYTTLIVAVLLAVVVLVGIIGALHRPH